MSYCQRCADLEAERDAQNVSVATLQGAVEILDDQLGETMAQHAAAEAQIRTLAAERDALRSAVVRVDQNHKEGSETEYFMYRREKALRAKAEFQLARLRPALDTLREATQRLDKWPLYRNCERDVIEAARALVALLPQEP